MEKYNYSSRCMRVGEMRCLFVSWYYSGKSPLFSYGPSCAFTVCLMFLAAIFLGFYEFTLATCEEESSVWFYLGHIGVVFNVLCLATGILKNPGIPQVIIDKALKAGLDLDQDNEKLIDIQ